MAFADLWSGYLVISLLIRFYSGEFWLRFVLVLHSDNQNMQERLISFYFFYKPSGTIASAMSAFIKTRASGA